MSDARDLSHPKMPFSHRIPGAPSCAGKVLVAVPRSGVTRLASKHGEAVHRASEALLRPRPDVVLVCEQDHLYRLADRQQRFEQLSLAFAVRCADHVVQDERAHLSEGLVRCRASARRSSK